MKSKIPPVVIRLITTCIIDHNRAINSNTTVSSLDVAAIYLMPEFASRTNSRWVVKSRRKRRFARPFRSRAKKGQRRSSSGQHNTIYTTLEISEGSKPPSTRDHRGRQGGSSLTNRQNSLTPLANWRSKREKRGCRRAVAANRRRSRSPMNPRVCAPARSVSRRVPFVALGYRAQGRGPITSLATAVGVTSSPTLSILSHPFDPSHLSPPESKRQLPNELPFKLSRFYPNFVPRIFRVCFPFIFNFSTFPF